VEKARQRQPDAAADQGSAAGRPPAARSAGSLNALALRLLAQREHGRHELARKLAARAESAEQLNAVLDRLQQGGLLSEQRFAEGLARRRADRFGSLRIQQEFQSLRVDARFSGPVLAGLRHTERERALSAWRKRFGQPPRSLEERARQHRFLAGRGFAADAIAWVLRHGAQQPPEADPSAAD